MFTQVPIVTKSMSGLIQGKYEYRHKNKDILACDSPSIQWLFKKGWWNRQLKFVEEKIKYMISDLYMNIVLVCSLFFLGWILCQLPYAADIPIFSIFREGSYS